MTRFCRIIAACTAVLIFGILRPNCAAQTRTSPQPMSRELDKYPGLLPEFSHLLDRLKRELQLPPARYQSNLLPLLPAATTYFVALPNFGDAAHQSLEIFHDELKQSSVLNDWWHREMAQSGPQFEDAIEKVYKVSQYLGDEIVIFGDTGQSNRRFVLAAELKKPGLAEYLRQLLKSLPEKSKPGFRILDHKELATAKSRATATDSVVLIRSDFVIAGPDLETVTTFNQLLDSKNSELSSTPFGQRLAQAYQAGTEAVVAADLHTILGRDLPTTPQNEAVFDHSGFKDVNYLVWNHRMVADQAISESELSFTSSRHGAASWLISPGPLGSLDFVSPKAVLVASLLLKNFGEIFDDLRELSSYSNPNASTSVAQTEQAMHINLRNDLLSQFQGEVTFALKELSPQQPVWNVIFRVNDPAQLQITLDKLAASSGARAAQSEEDGILYHSILVPSPQKASAFTYAFVDGFLILASSRESALETVRLHKSGESFAKSTLFTAPLPPGYSSDVSAMFYEDPAAMAASALRQLPMEAAAAVSQLTSAASPIVLRAYGEDTAIRGLSVGAGTDPSMMLIVAAVAIPNLLRARIAANEASAVATIRNVNTAQVTYSATYPQRGYAHDLASLGPDPRGTAFHSPQHAGMIDKTLGDPACIAGKWCSRNGYNFSLTATCKVGLCSEFVVLAAPADLNSGTRNFCSISDAIVRYKLGPPLSSPIGAAECRSWAKLQN